MPIMVSIDAAKIKNKGMPENIIEIKIKMPQIENMNPYNPLHIVPIV
jgi:hypothetical protein